MTLTAKGRTIALATVLTGVHVGLLDADGREEQDINYARVPVSFGEPSEAGDQTVRLNDERVEFPPYAADAKAQLRFWALYDDPLEGTELLRADLERPMLPMRGEAPMFPPGVMSVGLR